MAKSFSEDMFFKRFLAEFSNIFGAASSEHPNVRCVPKSELVREFTRIRDRLACPGFKSIPGKTILDGLIRSGLVHMVSLIEPDTGQPINKFFSIGLNEASYETDPIELLQAMVKNGVVCYFTAIHFHDLSTQIPTHHHIAHITDYKPNPMGASRVAHATKIINKTPRRLLDPLGKRKFVYKNVPYYVTSRDRRWIPGIQVRYFTDKTVFSITTFEQTLIDTLHRPLSCGGPSVVFEAWGNAVNKLDQSRFLHHLIEIDDDRMSRRAGYFLSKVAKCNLDVKVARYFQGIKKRLDRDDKNSTISLLPGYKYARVDHDWRLEVP